MKATNHSNNLTWWGRIEAIKKSLCLKYSPFSKLEVIDFQIKKCIKSKFQLYWLKLINHKNIGIDGKDHNKLRFYSKLKGCFQKEPYIDLVPNRAQRADLSRLRISSSRLAIETMRYQRPYMCLPTRGTAVTAGPWGTMRMTCRASLIMSTTF